MRELEVCAAIAIEPLDFGNDEMFKSLPIDVMMFNPPLHSNKGRLTCSARAKNKTILIGSNGKYSVE